jgi:hypothetical protein
MAALQGFQTQVETDMAPALAGDFASANPRQMVVAGPLGLQAGPNGLTVGRFAWLDWPADFRGSAAMANNYGTGAPDGFVHREQQAFITGYLSYASNLLPAGFETSLVYSGDLWALNDDTVQINPGDQIYADNSTGRCLKTATAGGATASTWGIAAATASFTGTITDNVMATSGAVTGTIYPGAVVTGSGVTTGTVITRQLSGTTGGAGTYEVSPPNQNVASTTITITYGTLTLTTVTAGSFGVNQVLTGASAGVTAGTKILQMLTGTGGSGSTAVVNYTQTSGNAGQGVLTGAGASATGWYAGSMAAPGEVFMISPNFANR